MSADNLHPLQRKRLSFTSPNSSSSSESQDNNKELRSRGRNIPSATNTKRNLSLEISTRFPWLVRKNYLPNFYTKRNASRHSKQLYQDAYIAFVHNQKSGGSTLKMCMKNMAPSIGADDPFIICDVNAGNYYQSMDTATVRVFHKFYAGGHTFRQCDYTTHACSYITILRDPFERAISSYEYCKVRNELHCQIRDATKVSLREWAKFQGSFFFRQLIYNPEYCTDKFDGAIDALRVKKGIPEAPRQIPCWYRNELMLSHAMTTVDKANVLDYVLENLEDWFAMIGINSEYDITLQLLEGAYQLPFSQCSGQELNYNPYIAEGEIRTHKQRNEIVADLRKQLYSDPEVFDALYYDLKIYQKAQEIFLEQKRLFFNK
nr:PREDICTED: uncharacterized protein LOC100369673 isoform X2 [Saccoglossus kowalevskii]